MNTATDPLRHRAIPSQGRIHAWEPWLSADLLLPPCSEANPSQTKFSTATAHASPGLKATTGSHRRKGHHQLTDLVGLAKNRCANNP